MPQVYCLEERGDCGQIYIQLLTTHITLISHISAPNLGTNQSPVDSFDVENWVHRGVLCVLSQIREVTAWLQQVVGARLVSLGIWGLSASPMQCDSVPTELFTGEGRGDVCVQWQYHSTEEEEGLFVTVPVPQGLTESWSGLAWKRYLKLITFQLGAMNRDIFH